jgi:hypothetical protein
MFMSADVRINLSGLSDAEIIELGEEEVARIIERACAEQGIPMLPERPMPIMERIKPDAVVYHFGEIHTATLEDAIKLQEFLAGLSCVKVSYINIPGCYQRRITAEADEPTFTTDRVFSLEAFESNERAIRDEKDSAAEIKEKREEYERVSRARNVVAREIYDVRDAAYAREARRQELRVAAARYLEIAEDNREIAQRFFRNVYAGDGGYRDVFEDVFKDVFADVIDTLTDDAEA